MLTLPDILTIEQAYAPAMAIRDAAEAADYFGALVERHIRMTKHTREEAEEVERTNLGYYAGYYDQETRDRVLRLFNAPHPFFGTEPATPERAFALGMELGRQAKAEVE